MLYFLLFARTDTIKKEWENLLSSFIPEPFHIETALFPDGPVSLLPENLPSCFLIDRSGMPKLPENTWLQLLSIQYPLIPILYYEEASAFREQLESLLLKETGGSLPTGNPCLSYAKSRSFLDNLTSLGSASPQEDPEFPDYSHVSFAVCAARLSDSSCDDPVYEACAMLTRKYPNSFCYLNRKQKILLFVLYEHTGNFTQLELNRQTLMEQAAATDSFLPPFKFGVIHHGLSGLVSSFLEAEQVYYVNRLRTPCLYFEQISGPPGQLLKAERLMEIERSIRTDIQFREGQNALAYTRQWFSEYRRLGYEPEAVKYDMIILYASIKYVLFDMYGLKLKRIKSGLEVHEIIHIATMDELEEWFVTWLLYTLDNFDLTRSNTGFRIQEVLQFISNHVMDDLSLNTIASYFYVNPSYFSTLFKKETGQTYISYITRLKMDKARELLAVNCKVYETAHLLGYEDIRHFRNTFKKYHGVSPSEVKPPPDGHGH